jgi:hypothetical protein
MDMSSGEKYGIAIELFALAVWVVREMTVTILPLVGWSLVVVCVIAGGLLIVHGRRRRSARQKQQPDKEKVGRQEIPNIEPQGGSLDTVTAQDRTLIRSIAVGMILKHGHTDLWGLLADRATGVPLNELMTRNCSECGIPRNQKSE